MVKQIAERNYEDINEQGNSVDEKLRKIKINSLSFSMSEIPGLSTPFTDILQYNQD